MMWKKFWGPDHKITTHKEKNDTIHLSTLKVTLLHNKTINKIKDINHREKICKKSITDNMPFLEKTLATYITDK